MERIFRSRTHRARHAQQQPDTHHRLFRNTHRKFDQNPAGRDTLSTQLNLTGNSQLESAAIIGNAYVVSQR